MNIEFSKAIQDEHAPTWHRHLTCVNGVTPVW
jgi:hypothetical protein